MAPRTSQNRTLQPTSSSSSGDGYGFFFAEEQDDREVPIQQALTCENLQAYSPTRKNAIVRNVSSCLSVSTMSTMSPNSSQQNSPRILEDREEKECSMEVQKNIVFVFENNRAPGKLLFISSSRLPPPWTTLTHPFLLSFLLFSLIVSCRSFESLVSSRITQVCISIEGFRIVQDSSGESAEFKIRMLLNNKEKIGWKSFKDFEELALACQEFSSGKHFAYFVLYVILYLFYHILVFTLFCFFFCLSFSHLLATVEVTSTSWMSMFRSTPPVSRLLRRSEASIDLTESLMAWEKVLDGMLWGWTLSRNLSIRNLMEESQNLENFLKCLLFEIPTPDILVEFIATH